LKRGGAADISPAGAAGLGVDLAADPTIFIGGLFKGFGLAAKKVFPKVSKTLSRTSKLEDIAKKEGLPGLSFGQKEGGKLLEQEKILQETFFQGALIRKKVSKQVEKIEENLKSVVGDFELESRIGDAGDFIKRDFGRTTKEIKNKASELFDDVAIEGRKVSISSQDATASLSKSLEPLGMFDELGNPIAYNPRNTELTDDTFEFIQKEVNKVMQDFKKGDVDATVLNNWRKKLNKKIKFGKDFQEQDVVLRQITAAMEDVTEKMLRAQNPGLADDWLEARALWSEQINRKNIEKSLLGRKGVADEKVINKIFLDTDRLNEFKALVKDPKMVENAGNEFVLNLIKSKSTRDAIRPESALKAIIDKKDVIIGSIGRQKYDKLVNNLEFLAEIKASINPSRTALVDLLKNELPAVPTNVLRQVIKGGKGIQKIATGDIGPKTIIGGGLLKGSAVKSIAEKNKLLKSAEEKKSRDELKNKRKRAFSNEKGLPSL